MHGGGGPRTAWLERRDRQGGAMVRAEVPTGPCRERRGVARRIAPAAPPPAGPKTTDAAPPLEVDDAASLSRSWSQLVVLGHAGSALGLAQSSPDPVRLTDAQCVVETGLSHRAGGADGFGLFFSPQLLALALEVRRWKEDDGLRAAACSSYLPVFLDALCTHRHTPFLGGPYSRSRAETRKRFEGCPPLMRRRCPRSAHV